MQTQIHTDTLTEAEKDEIANRKICRSHGEQVDDRSDIWPAVTAVV